MFLFFHMNFRISLSSFYRKRPARILGCIESIALGKCSILIVLTLLIYEGGFIPPLFLVCNLCQQCIGVVLRHVLHMFITSIPKQFMFVDGALNGFVFCFPAGKLFVAPLILVLGLALGAIAVVIGKKHLTYPEIIIS